MEALQLQNVVLSNGSHPCGSDQSLLHLFIALHILLSWKTMFRMQSLNHALFIYHVSVVELSSTMLVCSLIKVLIENTYNYNKWRASLSIRKSWNSRTRKSWYLFFYTCTPIDSAQNKTKWNTGVVKLFNHNICVTRINYKLKSQRTCSVFKTTIIFWQSVQVFLLLTQTRKIPVLIRDTFNENTLLDDGCYKKVNILHLIYRHHTALTC